MGLAVARLVETFGAYGPADGAGESGTGYLVADAVIPNPCHDVAVDIILTARHNVVRKDGSHLTCSVRLHGDHGWCEGVKVEWESEEFDLALLSAPPRTLTRAKEGVAFGRLGGSQPIPVYTVGYPLAQVRPDGVRDVEHPWGKVAPFTRVKAGQLVMSVESSPPERRADGGSPWAGMSGAPLFAGERLVGVVARVDPAAFGTDRLVAEPITRLLDHAEAARLCRLDDAQVIDVMAQVSSAGTAVGERLAISGRVATSVAPGPAVTGAFTGRVEDLAWLDKVVGGADPGIAVLHGLGGVGKTTVAAKYFAGHESAGGPCWWIGADSATNVTENLAAAARGLRLSGDTSEDLAREALTWLVQQEDFLLVLDNVETPKDVERVLARLRPARAERIVITTRLAVGWTADHMRVRPVGVLAPEEAVRLLERIAGRDAHDAWHGAGDLVEELGYLPLAVEQVGAFLGQPPGQSPGQFLDQYRLQPSTALEARAYGSDGERTVARIWGVAFERLAGEAPDALQVLGALAWLAPDDVPLDLLDTLDDVDAPAAVGVLAAWNLVIVNGPTVSVHRLVQAVARTTTAGWPSAQTIERSRTQATGALTRAFRMQDVDAPASWPRVRDLLPSVEAYTAVTDPLQDDTDASYLLDRAATYLQTQGAVAQAIAWFERALASQVRVLGADAPDALFSRHNLAVAYRVGGRVQEAIVLFEQVLADRVRVLGADAPGTLVTRHNLAAAYEVGGRVQEAIVLFEHVLADQVRVLGEDAPGTLVTRTHLAFAYRRAGRVREAIVLFEQTLPDQVRVLGVDAPDTLGTRHALAVAYRDGGRVREAIVLFEQVLVDRVRVLGADAPGTLATRHNLAGAYQAGGRVREAIVLFEQVLADQVRVLGADAPDVLVSRNNLAVAYQAGGRVREAIVLFEQVLADQVRVLSGDAPGTLATRHNLAVAYQVGGRVREAIDLAEQNVNLAQARFGTRNRITLVYQDRQGEHLVRAGRAAEAAEKLARALSVCEEALGFNDLLTLRVRQRLTEARGQAG